MKTKKNLRKLLTFQEIELSKLKFKKIAWPENQKLLTLVFKHKRK